MIAKGIIKNAEFNNQLIVRTSQLQKMQLTLLKGSKFAKTTKKEIRKINQQPTTINQQPKAFARLPALYPG